MSKKCKINYVPEHIFENIVPEQRLIVYIIILKILIDKLSCDNNKTQQKTEKKNPSQHAIESLILDLIREVKKNINDKQGNKKDEKETKSTRKVNASSEILEEEKIEKGEDKKISNIEHKEYVKKLILQKIEKYKEDNADIKKSMRDNKINENSNDFSYKKKDSCENKIHNKEHIVDKENIADKEHIVDKEHVNKCILQEVEKHNEDNIDIKESINDNKDNESSNDFLDVKKDTCENKIYELPKINHKIICSKVTSCKSATLQCQTSKNIEENFSNEPLVSDVSVILSNIEMQIFIETLTKLPEPVLNVKSLDKKVFLNQCQLITGTNKLFLKGFIQENIEYANAKCIKENKIEGMVKKITLNIPFQCTTKVIFSIEPKVSKFSSTLDFELLDSHSNGIDNNIKSYEHFQFLNEKVFCNINDTEVFETCNQEGIKILEKGLVKTHTFKRMRKKIIVTLKLSLLQNQKVFIFKATPD